MSNLAAIKDKMVEISTRHGITEILEGLDESYQIHVAFLGEFSSGKTSLVNALLGKKLFPVFSKPTNAIITEIYKSQDGNNHFFIVHGTEERQVSQSDLVDEITNPEPGKILKAYVASDILTNDYCIIDTPGTSSLENLHEEILFGYLPSVDVAMIVIDAAFGGATKTLLDFLKQMPKEILRKIYIIINKIDLLNEKDREKVKVTLQGQLSDFIPVERILLASAKYALEGIEKNDESLIENSGIKNIRNVLFEEIPQHKKEVVEQRLKEELKRRVQQLIKILEEKISAISWTDEELEKKIECVQKEKEELERSYREFQQKLYDIRDDSLKKAEGIIDKYIEIISSKTAQGEESYTELERLVSNMVEEIADIVRKNVEEILNIQVPGFNNSFKEYLVISAHHGARSIKQLIDTIFELAEVAILIWIFPGEKEGAEAAEVVPTLAIKLIEKIGLVKNKEKLGKLEKAIKHLIESLNILERISMLITKPLVRLKLKRLFSNIISNLKSMWDDVLIKNILEAVKEEYVHPIKEKEELLVQLRKEKMEKIKSADQMRDEIQNDIAILRSLF